MVTLMQPLRDEHSELRPHIDALRDAADAVGFAELDALRAAVDRCRRFLSHQLIPHATAEDKALYPVVQRVMGAGQATATMSRDHIEVGRLTDELAALEARLGDAQVLDD